MKVTCDLPLQGYQDHDQSSFKFSDVVDEDIAHLEERISINLLGKLLESLAFRMLMLCFILVNCVVIGIQTDKYLVSELSYLWNIKI